MALFFFAANIALGVFGSLFVVQTPLVDKVSTQISPPTAVAIYCEFDCELERRLLYPGGNS